MKFAFFTSRVRIGNVQPLVAEYLLFKKIIVLAAACTAPLRNRFQVIEPQLQSGPYFPETSRTRLLGVIMDSKTYWALF